QFTHQPLTQTGEAGLVTEERFACDFNDQVAGAQTGSSERTVGLNSRHANCCLSGNCRQGWWHRHLCAIDAEGREALFQCADRKAFPEREGEFGLSRLQIAPKLASCL